MRQGGSRGGPHPVPRQTQAALDGWVEQVADLLREIDATGSDLADRLRVAALNAGGSQSTAAPRDKGAEGAAGATTRDGWTSARGEVSR